MLALAAGLAVANLYYNQPVLGLVAAELKGGDHVALVATITQIGYTLGLLLLYRIDPDLALKQAMWLVVGRCVWSREWHAQPNVNIVFLGG